MRVNREQAVAASVFAGLVALGVASRLWEAAPNLTAVGACALMAGFFFRSRLLAVMVPLITMGLSDVFVGGYSLPLMLVVYGAMALPVLLAPVVKSCSTVSGRLTSSALMALVGACAFYLITNFAVWALGTMYPHTASGLAACYAAAVPFFRNAAIGDVGFALGLFGLHALATRVWPETWARTATSGAILAR